MKTNNNILVKPFWGCCSLISLNQVVIEHLDNTY